MPSIPELLKVFLPASVRTIIKRGIATADASGAGPGAVLNQDGTLNSAANPAAAGSIVSLFGTGAGWTTPQLFMGAYSISTPYPTPLNNVAVTIGGQPANVTATLFKGV